MSIRLKLLLFFLSLSIVMIALGTTSLIALSRVNTTATTLENEVLPSVAGMLDIKAQLAMMRSFELESLLAEKEQARKEYQDRIRDAIDAIHASESDVSQHTLGDKQTALFSDYKNQLSVYLAEADKVQTLAKSGKREDAIAEFSGPAFALFDKLLDIAEQIARANTDASTGATVLGEAQYQQSRTLLLILLAAGLLIGLVGGTAQTILVEKRLVKPLGEAVRITHAVSKGDLTQRIDTRGADETATLMRALAEMTQSLQKVVGTVRQTSSQVRESSRLVAGAASDLSSSAGAQHESAAHASQSAQEIAEGIQSVSSFASNVHDQAQHSLESSERGMNNLHNLEDGISRARTAVGEMTEIVKQFVQSTQTITQMTREVRDIANQTNLLALNAAIEAARAGEHGRGFAVVADEVRKLAEKSARSAEGIDSVTQALETQSSIVEEAITRSLDSLEEGQSHMLGVNEVLGEAEASVRRTSSGVDNIQQSIEEQTSIIASIANDVELIASKARETNAASEENARAARDLDRCAHELSEAVAYFRI